MHAAHESGAWPPANSEKPSANPEVPNPEHQNPEHQNPEHQNPEHQNPERRNPELRSSKLEPNLNLNTNREPRTRKGER